jgi:hypothetical protein
MIKVLNSANETLAILENTWNTTLSEGLNREFTFDFSTVIDGDKSAYITTSNKVEIKDDYFNITYFRKNRTIEGITLDVQCEHVSYDLISASFTAGFTATGLFSAVATALLSGTGFTVGTVQVTSNQTISINESTNAFNVLKQLATLYSGELEFDKYQVNLLTQRGTDRHVQFRYRKNISNAIVTVDGRQKTAGIPKTVYEISPVELEFEQSYITKEISSFEHYELGDTVLVIDDDLGINNYLRIVKHSYDPEQRMQGTVEISNFVDDLTDTISEIKTTTVAKNSIYNGCSIGPDNGFVAERSDAKARTTMNATDGIEIDLKPTTTSSYTAVFYVQVDTATGTAKLYLGGDAILTGAVAIGTGNNIFKADTNGIYLGNTTFGSAPFRVTMSGSATANDLTLTGGRFNVGTGTSVLQFNTTDGLFLGNTAVASAPFSVTMSGTLTATSAEINGRFTTKTTGGTTLMDVYQDTEGGKIAINDNSGNLNVKLGVEGGTGDNVGGTLILYNDGAANPRVTLGILTSDDVGTFQALDTNEIVRIQIQGYNATYSSSFIGIRDSSQVLKTYLLETEGYVNNEKIATENWVTANFTPL